MKIVSFSLEGGNRYFGRVDGGSKFFIGKRAPYLGGKDSRIPKARHRSDTIARLIAERMDSGPTFCIRRQWRKVAVFTR